MMSKSLFDLFELFVKCCACVLHFLTSCASPLSLKPSGRDGNSTINSFVLSLVVIFQNLKMTKLLSS